MDFASSGYARDFFQGQVPQIIRSLQSIADSQEKLVALFVLLENIQILKQMVYVKNVQVALLQEKVQQNVKYAKLVMDQILIIRNV